VHPEKLLGQGPRLFVLFGREAVIASADDQQFDVSIGFSQRLAHHQALLGGDPPVAVAMD
jgi:hypothetical protein